MAVNRTVVIAVDGPAASGKGTLARRLAAHFGYAHLDSGLLYRATALRLLRRGDDPGSEAAAVDASRGITAADLGDAALRGDEVAAAAGVVAAFAGVRAELRQFQLDFIARPPGGEAGTATGPPAGVVMDGRDIGTVICPGADVKIFVDASPETRAKRRLKELRERGVESIYSGVLQDMKERDARDRGRRVAPLVPAQDAYLLDTTELDADAAFAAVLEFINTRNMPKG